MVFAEHAMQMQLRLKSTKLKQIPSPVFNTDANLQGVYKGKRLHVFLSVKILINKTCLIELCFLEIANITYTC